MATVIDYDYIPEVSTMEALHNLTSDVTTWYDPEVPWVNTFKINAEVSTYNFPEWEWWLWIAGWSTDVKWTPSTWSISWTSGDIYLPDWTQISISSGSANVTTNTYLYVDMQDWTVYSTNSWIDAVGENKIMICAAFPNSWKNVTFKAFGCADQNSLTTGSDIASGTIVANNIASNTITSSQIASNTITANEIASNTITASEIASGAITTAKIAADAVTAGKIDVSQLSAISANLGSITAWDITWTTITAGSTSGTAIKLNPTNKRIDFYYNWSLVWYMAWASVDGNSAILLNADYVWMIGRDTFDLYNAKLRIPVWTDLYN